MPANIKPTKEQQAGIDKLTANLKTLRAAAGLSQYDMASKVGVSRNSYCSYESNRVTMSWNTYLAFMCFFLHCEKTKPIMDALGVKIPPWATTNQN